MGIKSLLKGAIRWHRRLRRNATERNRLGGAVNNQRLRSIGGEQADVIQRTVHVHNSHS